MKRLNNVFATAFILFTVSTFNSFAQRDIEPTLIFTDTVSYKFSGEWQYLSTDIYLLNGERFSTLINELDFVRKQNERSGWRSRRSNLSDEYLEYLFITARLKNVKFFGDSDVTYPLYNFQISQDKDEKYQTYVSDNIEKIRIIDNLPLYSASDFIDAEINVRAITNNDRDQILGLIASQLQNISKIQTPTGALLGIIGEFGNFIEANTKKKEYRFSSTIRLFEQKNFDTRLHSIRIYALLTANSEPVLLNTMPIKYLLDSTENPQVTRQHLTEIIDHSKYPLIIVANYKSLYRMEQVTGDEINFANIEKRKLKIENDYRAGLINAETYRQERDFISFITVFANLKNHLEVYSLNYKTGNSDAISGSLFKLLQYYRQLLKTNEEIVFKYRGNSTYQNVFKNEYQSILGYANLYLNEDHNLKRLFDLVQTLVQLEKSPSITSVASLEAAISALRFADIFKPSQADQSLEGQLIKMHLQKLEQQLYSSVFEKTIESLKIAEANHANKNAPENLRNMIRNTDCGLCRSKGFDAIDDFNNRFEDFSLQLALASRDSIVSNLQPWVFSTLKRLELAKENIAILYPNATESETKNYLLTKLAEAERDVRNLQDFSRIDLSNKERSMVETLNTRLLSAKKQAQDAMDLVCTLKPDLCKTIEIKPTPSPVDRQKELTQTYTTLDSVVRQTNIFIAIFDFQLMSIVEKGKENSELRPLIAQANEKLQKLKVAIDLYSENLSHPQRIKNLDREILILTKDISDLLRKLEK